MQPQDGLELRALQILPPEGLGEQDQLPQRTQLLGLSYPLEPQPRPHTVPLDPQVSVFLGLISPALLTIAPIFLSPQPGPLKLSS